MIQEFVVFRDKVPRYDIHSHVKLDVGLLYVLLVWLLSALGGQKPKNIFEGKMKKLKNYLEVLGDERVAVVELYKVAILHSRDPSP